jgi:hypothetical protein
MSIEDKKPAVVVRAPSDIWLTVGDLADCAGCDVEFGDLREVSWCEDQIDVSDVKYVRADLYKDPVDLAQLILKQHSEIERLKGLLREAADDLVWWGGYATEGDRKEHELAADIQKYRQAGEATK